MAPWHSIRTEYCRKQRDSQPSIENFTPDGVGTVFADGADGLASPFGLAFDTAGNLYVSNGTGGPTHTGSVLKFAPDGVGSMFADTGLDFPFGLAFDRAGNLYVSNYNTNTIEEFSPTGEDLGVFAYHWREPALYGDV